MLDALGDLGIACLICGNNDTRPLCEVNGFLIRSCPVCLSDFVWPMPDDATIQGNYKSANYFNRGDSALGYSDYDRQTENVLPFFRGILDRLGPGDGRLILDIGCAYGSHLALAARAGWQVFGVEVSEHARKVIQARHGNSIPVVASVSQLPSHTWDLVLLFDVMEHLRDPYRLFLDLAERGAIGPNTRIVATTPNTRSTAAISEPASWVYRTPPEHLIYFSSLSLALFFSALGFERVDLTGLYRLDDSTTPNDAIEWVDKFLSPYAGLSCEASGFQIAAADLPSALVIKRKLLREITVQLHRSPFIDALFRAITNEMMAAGNAKSEALKALTATVDAQRAELEDFRRSRLFQLTEALGNDQPMAHRLKRVLWILGSWLVPRSIKRFVLPVLRPIKVDERTSWRLPEPYIVRSPASLKPHRPKVVHAIANFMIGGSTRLVVDLIEQMGEDYDQQVITSFLPSPPAYVGVNIREFRDSNSSKPLLAYFSAVRPQLLHVHFWGGVDTHWYRQVFEAAKKYGCKIVENINTPVSPFVANGVHRYVFVSNYIRREFGQNVPNAEVIHPGSDMELFSRAPTMQPVDDSIGMVYRLEPDKLNERAIDVFIETVRRRPGTHALIGGGGSLQASFQRAVSKAGLDDAFAFPGYIRYEDLPAFYGQMSVFVAPVWKESFGQVSPFAMSMGLPVVGYDVGALAEIIGTRELLAPPGDSAALAAIIVRLLDDRERRIEIGRANQIRAREMFGVDIMIRRYRQLYRELMTTSP